MQLNGFKYDEFFVVKVNGRMDAVSAPEFEKSCLEWIQQGESAFIVDLGGLEYMSSAGLRSILVVGKKLKAAGGNISFASLMPDVAHLFSISGFGAMFPVHESLDKAFGRA
jgi:anti-anti-sigma factor